MSNLIKPSQYMPIDMLKELDLSRKYPSTEPEERETAVFESELQPEVQHTLESAQLAKQEMLQDAKEFAERQIREAAEAAEQLLSQAQEQIAVWWEERRSQDESIAEGARAEGFQQGYEAGSLKAQQEMNELLQQAAQEAQGVLSQAYSAKEELIQEAEPFLVELSCSVAEKIVDHQLTLEPDFVLKLIRKNLARKKEKGMISLCVAPSQFAFVHAAREELALSVDSQAELQVLPDSTVTDLGCVIRSSFGSVDARIDTQLSEIKKELIRISLDDTQRRAADE
ncbi:flagellar assembly protein FliH [Paenibacillus sp. F411]|uniref:FliH/SctL family protein n=1 Tax=Paenibacillus sp. F411 TaxID=2820239 RepID=UPI001AAE823E|nr:FliH/SctL family protein [Paenibacillus sp. F411]MBO2945757.1 flagellar assembly protein FliH [Paenibacillus sp. F411]